jgi:hypothetical protein
MFQDPIFLVAANLAVAVLIRVLKPNLLTAGLLAVVLIVSTGYLGTKHGTEIVEFVYRGRDVVLTMTGRPPSWPPEKNRSYPDLELVDQNGDVTRLSDFRGKVILLEPVGIACEACVAFSGGHERGAFDGISPQLDLDSIAQYARDYGRVRLDDQRIVHVQLILFNKDMEAPTAEEVRAWSDHFGFDRSKNRIVLAGTPRMATKASRDLVPGFQLIDRSFVLRADSTGNEPQDNLYTKLLPLLRKLARNE